MSSILQVIFAFIYVLVVPGFAASLAAFPRLNQLEITERIALSIGLSLTIVITLGLAIGYVSTLVAATGGITAYSLIIGIGLITVFFLVIWALRRAELTVAERREAARPERQMVLDARRAKSNAQPVRSENVPQAETRPRQVTPRGTTRRPPPPQQ